MVQMAQFTWYALARPLPTKALLFSLTLADDNRHADVHSDFANLDDLWHYDRILRDLDEKQDDGSDVADEREPVMPFGTSVLARRAARIVRAVKLPPNDCRTRRRARAKTRTIRRSLSLVARKNMPTLAKASSIASIR